MKKRNFLTLIFGLCFSMSLIMPVYAEQPTNYLNPDGAVAPEPLTPSTANEQYESLMSQVENMIDDIDAFGPSPNFTTTSIGGYAFQDALNSSGQIVYEIVDGKIGRSGSAASTNIFWAPIDNVPSGAVVVGIDIETCDSTSSGAIQASWHACADIGSGNCPAVGSVYSTGSSATPGCRRVLIDTPDRQVWNIFETYLAAFQDTTTGSGTTFRNMRLYWVRTISPAPASATFDDVSNSAYYFQGVEALASAGITQGCNPPTNNLFCPNANVTRGQMAVFLARALGLNWPG